MNPHVDWQSDADSIWRMLCEIEGDTAFDIGANGGRVARKLAERFETVIAVEPATESFGELVKSMSSTIVPLNVALSDKPGTVHLRETALTATLGELFTDDDLDWGDHVGYRDVEATTLDALSARYGFPDFVKIDTEGHEAFVMRGGVETFAQKPRFVIEVHSATKGSEVLHMLGDVAYTIHHHRWDPYPRDHYWVTSTS